MTFANFGDQYLVEVQKNGVNATNIDMPNYSPENLKLNHNPRNGRFNSTRLSSRQMRWVLRAIRGGERSTVLDSTTSIWRYKGEGLR